MKENLYDKIVFGYIRYMLDTLDISVYYMAKRLGMNYYTLRNKLLGERSLTLDECIMIRDYLDPDISLDIMFNRG